MTYDEERLTRRAIENLDRCLYLSPLDRPRALEALRVHVGRAVAYAALLVGEASPAARLTRRIAAGATEHGALCLATDAREWGAEALDELLDAAWYVEGMGAGR